MEHKDGDRKDFQNEQVTGSGTNRGPGDAHQFAAGQSDAYRSTAGQGDAYRPAAGQGDAYRSNVGPGSAGARQQGAYGGPGYPGGYGAPGYPGGYGAAPGWGPMPAYAMPQQNARRKNKMKGWQIALMVTGIVVVFVAILAVLIGLLGSGNRSNEGFSSPGEPYMARLYVVGEISSAEDPYTSSYESYHHFWTLDTIDELINDDRNKALMLYVDTPGGGVFESDELYLKIEEYKAETGRPVYIYMSSLAASGGYYISAPADKIYANRNTWTGSIGVIIGTFFDVSGFLETHGIKAEDITSGANKGMGSYFAPMTEEQRGIYQSLVDEAYSQFVGIVATGRGMTVEEVKAVADGRILSANQALEAGLIDQVVLKEEEATDAMASELGDPDIRIQDFSYSADTAPLFDSLLFELVPMPPQAKAILEETWRAQRAADESSLPPGIDGDVASVLKLVEENNRSPLKYLYQK